MNWSYSSLTAFETCPRRYYHVKVAKDVQETPSEATTWGNTVHEAIDNRLRNNTPLPESMQKYEGLVNLLDNISTDYKFSERKLCINADFEPTEWFAKDAWCRGIVDAGVRYGEKVVAFDWKTGKPKKDSDQLQLFAALLLHHHPEVKEVRTCFVWLAHDQTTMAVAHRNQLPDIWNNFLPRVKRLQIALDGEKFLPRPSGLCKNYCLCVNCEFHGV